MSSSPPYMPYMKTIRHFIAGGETASCDYIRVLLDKLHKHNSSDAIMEAIGFEPAYDHERSRLRLVEYYLKALDDAAPESLAEAPQPHGVWGIFYPAAEAANLELDHLMAVLPHVLFEHEIDALRWANSHDRAVARFIQFGEPGI